MVRQKDLHQHEGDLKSRIQDFCLLDDEFMTLVFDGNIEATELLLHIIFGRDDLVVTEVVGQKEIKNASGRSVRLDIHAKDNTGKNYDIEIQRARKGANVRRARYYSGMLDTRMLKPGQEFEELADSYVIFITEQDVLGEGLPLYHVDRRINGTKRQFGDGSHILYVNGAYSNEEDAIGRLMHDFKCSAADEMHYKVLADRVRYFKEEGGGREDMSELMEEICKEFAAYYAEEMAEEMAAKIVAKAKHDYCVEMAIRMLEDRFELQQVALYSGLSLTEVEKLARDKMM